MWDKQSTAAERMCADILRLEGFLNVDPQSPLGGRDGGKDILCDKDDMAFVAACHFSNSDLSFTATKKKFGTDLTAALGRKRDGFIFMTNQQLTPGERTTLEEIARKKGQRCLIHHREYLRVVLDSPKGYGLRLRHLGISLTADEQAAFFAVADASTAAAMRVHTQAIDRLTGQVARIARAQMGLLVETMAVVVDAVRRDRSAVDIAQMLKRSADAAAKGFYDDPSEALSSRLSVAFVRYVHRLLLPFDSTFAGHFRQTQVWLVDPTGQSNVDLECVSWDKVPGLLRELIENWNRDYPNLVKDRDRLAIAAMAKFFSSLLAIHPFIDGNGRVGRALLSLQARDLFSLSEDLLLDRGAAYYTALKMADADDYSALETLIEDAIEAAA
jgi:fido (protein-threonine AMPylation protein)